MARYETGLFIYNGNEDSNVLETNLSQTIPILTQEVKELKVLQTDSLDEFKEACRNYGPEVDVLFILGGDGTVHEGINSMADLERRPVIGVLPGGTCNDFSRVLDTPRICSKRHVQLLKGKN